MKTRSLNPRNDKQLKKALKLFPKLVKEQERNYKARERDIKRFEKLSKQLAADQSAPHPWRVCPYGEHWVRTHPMRVKPSKRNPQGGGTTRHDHCARNRSGKDHLYVDEIEEIATRNFSTVKNKPCPLALDFPNGNTFDDLIGGWVQYWNDVLKPPEPLDPNFVKALVATESGFRQKLLANPRNSNSARGLMQVNNQARRALGDPKGELKDHFVNTTKADLNDPNVNICSGVRWLFNKRERASAKLGHTATWLEAVEEYKGLSKVPEKRRTELLSKLQEVYKQLAECAKARTSS